MSAEERMRAELEILGLDASRHVVDTYAEFLDALGAVRSQDLLRQRSRSEILVAGVKVATQTPPVRSGRRVVFLTLDDGTGPVDATFFEDAQGPYAATVFGSWLLVVRGEVRRTGHRGVSLRATGCLGAARPAALWQRAGIEAVRERDAGRPGGFGGVGVEPPSPGRPSRSSRPAWRPRPPCGDAGDEARPRPPAAWAGAGCWCTPAGSRCRPTPTSSRPARTPRTSPASCGTAAPGAPDEHHARRRL